MSIDGNETDAYQQFGGPAEISGSNPMLEGATEQKTFTQFMQERNNFPVFYQRDGELRQVKTEIGTLPPELNPIGQEGLVFDSESAQKNKSDLELSEKIKSTRENLIDTTLLESPISDLTKQNIKDMGFPSFVSEALDQVKTTPEFSKFSSLTTRKFLNNLIEGLDWKLANIGNEKGMGGKYVANLLSVDANGASFSRSARFNSEDKITAVADAALAQEVEKFNKFQSEFKTDSITKQQAQQLNKALKQEGIHLHVDMTQFTPEQSSLTPKFVMDVNFISAMDSAKGGEDKFWKALDSAHDALRDNAANRTKTVGGVEFSLGQSLLTEASQSSFGGGMAASLLGSSTKTDKRASQLDQRFALLNAQKGILGDDCYTQGFKEFLANPTQVLYNESIGVITDLKGPEKAFVDYYKACSLDRTYKGEFDDMFPAPTNVFTLEMGDVAFAELTGVHDHVSCKSGQDRTLSLVALRSAVAKCGWPSDPTPELTGGYKDNFTSAFVETVATQAKSVVEHARGEGGKLKYNLDEIVNKQPVPGAIFDYLESDLAKGVRSEIALDENLKEGLKSVKLPTGKLKSALGFDTSIGTKDLSQITKDVCSLFPKDKGQDVRILMTQSFGKKQSEGKQSLLNSFEQLSALKQEFDFFKDSFKSSLKQQEFCEKFITRIEQAEEQISPVEPGNWAKLRAKVSLGNSKPLTQELSELLKDSFEALKKVSKEVSKEVSDDLIRDTISGISNEIKKDLNELKELSDKENQPPGIQRTQSSRGFVDKISSERGTTNTGIDTKHETYAARILAEQGKGGGMSKS